MNIANHPRIMLAACCLALFSGCGLPLRISQTGQFYSATSDAHHAPKPDDYPMPVLVYPPKRKYKVIGYFTMRSKQQDFGFMEKAAQYNARRAGGDAVLVLERWRDPYSFIYYPNETTTTTEVTDPQSKADARAGKTPTTHEETTTDWGDPATGTGWSNLFDSQIIVYK